MRDNILSLINNLIIICIITSLKYSPIYLSIIWIASYLCYNPTHPNISVLSGGSVTEPHPISLLYREAVQVRYLGGYYLSLCPPSYPLIPPDLYTRSRSAYDEPSGSGQDDRRAIEAFVRSI